MIEYCLGFVFDTGFESVVLMLKEKGLHVGTWNGLGGKIEPKERPVDAMRREYKEESNDHEIENWYRVCWLEGKDWLVHVFAAFEPDCVDTWNASHILDDEMKGTLSVRLDGYDDLPLAPHVPLLITASIQMLKNPQYPSLHLKELSSFNVE